MSETDAASTGSGESLALADRTDFYRAWKLVDGAEGYSPNTRGRAFSVWVALFGCVNTEGVVTRNSTEVAAEFSVSRAAWLQYRELLAEVGLIKQERLDNVEHRPLRLTLRPPLKSKGIRKDSL